MNRSLLRRMLRETNAVPIASHIIGSADDDYRIEPAAVIERLQNEVAKLNLVIERIEKITIRES